MGSLDSLKVEVAGPLLCSAALRTWIVLAKLADNFSLLLCSAALRTLMGFEGVRVANLLCSVLWLISKQGSTIEGCDRAMAKDEKARDDVARQLLAQILGVSPLEEEQSENQLCDAAGKRELLASELLSGDGDQSSLPSEGYAETGEAERQATSEPDLHFATNGHCKHLDYHNNAKETEPATDTKGAQAILQHQNNAKETEPGFAHIGADRTAAAGKRINGGDPGFAYTGADGEHKQGFQREGTERIAAGTLVGEPEERELPGLPHRKAEGDKSASNWQGREQVPNGYDRGGLGDLLLRSAQRGRGIWSASWSIALAPHITGTMVNYFFVCKRKLWFFSHHLECEHDSDLVRRGKLLHQYSYMREEKEIDIDQRMVLDWYDRDRNVVCEVKSSDHQEEAHRWQVLFYLWYLKHKGMRVASGIEEAGAMPQERGTIGELRYPRQKQRMVVVLTPEAEQRMEQEVLPEIFAIVQQEQVPERRRKDICSACAYYELCFVEEPETKGEAVR